MALVSIENFNPAQVTPPYLTSPRSLEACKRTGIDPSELLMRPQELFLKGKITKAEKEIAKQQYKHFEERRSAKVQEVTEERMRIIEEEKAGSIEFVSSKRSVSTQHNSSVTLTSGMIEKEKRELEKMQRKQAQEIMQMVEYEKKMGSIRSRNEEKEALMRQKEAARQEELQRKQAEYEAFKAKDEARRRKLKEDEEARVKQMTTEEQRKARKREQEEKALEMKRLQEAKARDEERQRRTEELKANTQKIMEEQQRRFQERKLQMDLRDQKRQEAMEEKQRSLRLHSEQVKLIKERKLQAARANLAGLNEAQRSRFEQRQRESEEKRVALEKNRMEHIEELRRKGEIKEKQIQHVSEVNKAKEEARLKIYQDSVAKAEQLQSELQREKDKELKTKLEREHEKQGHIAQVRVRMQAIESDRVSRILTKQTQKETTIQKIREKQLFEESLKRNEAEMKRRDRFDAVQKLSRIQDYQKLKVLAKIESDAERAGEVQRQKEMLFEQRRRLRESITAKKKEILEKFEDIKKKNRSEAELQEALNSLIPATAAEAQASAPAKPEQKSAAQKPTEQKPPAQKPVESPQPQIFATAPREESAYTVVETKPAVTRSTLPPEGED